MERKCVHPVLILTTLAVCAGLTPAMARVHPCQLTAEIKYTPQLDGTEATRSFAARDTLSCPASPDAALGVTASAGIRSAGNIWTDPATGFKWQEPAGSATGTCTAQEQSATSIIRWNGGGVTVVQESTSTTVWGVRSTGAVVPDVTLGAVNPQLGQPAALTVSTTVFVGRSTSGLLASRVNAADPLECSETGVTTAFRDGVYVIA